MGINDIIIYIMVAFMALGAIDKVLGNKFGIGEQFEEGIMAMGTLAIAMIGVICLAPVISTVLEPVVVPVFTALGADPAMFAGALLANDMGGYSLAVEMAQNPAIGNFSGLILGSMMGATVVFIIPVALGIINKEDTPFFAKGVLAGVITIPIGCIAGGLVQGLTIGTILVNLVPIIIVAALIALGLWKAPNAIIKGFTIFGKGVTAIITIGLAAAIIEALTGIVVIPGMAPIEEGITVVGDIAIVLAGALPLVYVITKVFKKPLMKVGALLGINEVAAGGMIAALANTIPMFGMMKDMDNRGKVISVAFAVSASFILGDHLGFTAGVNKDMISAMMIAKIVAAITAVIVACIITPKNDSVKA